MVSLTSPWPFFQFCGFKVICVQNSAEVHMKNAGLQLSPQRAESETLQVKAHWKASTGNDSPAGSEGPHLGDSASSLTGQSFSRQVFPIFSFVLPCIQFFSGSFFLSFSKIFCVLLFYFLSHLVICAYIVCAISPPTSRSLPLPPTSLLPGRNCSTLISNIVEERV
jgi:hypothetical protein